MAQEPVELVEGEVLGVGAGRVALQAEVDRVGAVLERGEARLEPAGGGEELDGAGLGALCAGCRARHGLSSAGPLGQAPRSAAP